MASIWFFEDKAAKFGPYSLLEMQGLIHIGRITRKTRVQKGSAGEWHTAGCLEVLFDQPAINLKSTPQSLQQKSLQQRRLRTTEVIPSNSSPLKRLPVDQQDASSSKQTHWFEGVACSLIVHCFILLVMGFIILHSIDQPQIEISTIFEDHDENEMIDSQIGLTELGVEVSQVNFVDLNVIPKPSLINLENQMDRSVDRMAKRIGNDLEGNLEKGSGFARSVFKRRLNRENAQTGAVQVSLIWEDVNDIDLHVFPPSKEHIWYSNKFSICKGRLDVDMNVSVPYSTEPVENIFWPFRKAPHGKYQVFVHYYRRNGGPTVTPILLMLTVDGKSFILEDQVRVGSPQKLVVSFDYPLTAKTKIALSVESKRREKKEKVALVELAKLEEFLEVNPKFAEQRFLQFAKRFQGTFAAEKAKLLAKGLTLGSR